MQARRSQESATLEASGQNLRLRCNVTKRSLIARAWNNGRRHASGAGYGLKIAADARDAFFHRDWGTVVLHLSGRTRPMTVNIDKASFWNDTCRELISRDIGSWLAWLHGLGGIHQASALPCDQNASLTFSRRKFQTAPLPTDPRLDSPAWRVIIRT